MRDITQPASGRFLVRVDPELHARLRDEARLSGVSLNDCCVRKLSAPGPGLPTPAARALRHAESALAKPVLGAVAYGSWARGEETSDSDVDILLVLPASAGITRELYRLWDENPPDWEGRLIEPHFVRLPEPGAEITGTWAEVALDGIMLFDPTLAVSRTLASIRRRMLEGEIVRRWASGQPYWTTAS
jgi:predicted nucleotidyltransferase